MADDRGESLIEILVAMVILGITGVAVLGGLMTGIQVSDQHRKQTTAGTYARDYAEGVATFVAPTMTTVTTPTGGTKVVTTTKYKQCAGIADYPVALPSGVTGPGATYVSSITSVEYWTGTTWAATCSTDQGLQRVTVAVRSQDNKATETSVIVIRNPCGLQPSPC
ncbi:prepilin-type N-terminal cleavage/methylation domain-containing protein [Geodermatophilus sp. SYSU D01062]